MQLRSKIKAKIKSLLINKTLAGDRVFRDRILPNQDWPSINIYSHKESLSMFTQAPKEYKRVLNIVIEGIVKIDCSNVERGEVSYEQVELLEHQVEQMLSYDYTLEGLVSNIELDNIEFNMDHEGDTILGTVKMSYSVEYITDDLTARAFDDVEGVNMRLEFEDKVFTGEVDYESQ